MKKYLYKKWEEETKNILGEILVQEEDFRSRGCPVCGPAIVGNGEWVAYGGYALFCPHLRRYINKKNRERIKAHQLILRYISVEFPADAALLYEYDSVASSEERKSRTSDGKTLAVCRASKAL
jgi:hypothetical protein